MLLPHTHMAHCPRITTAELHDARHGIHKLNYFHSRHRRPFHGYGDEVVGEAFLLECP
jgi:hypothetical protein